MDSYQGYTTSSLRPTARTLLLNTHPPTPTHTHFFQLLLLFLHPNHTSCAFVAYTPHLCSRIGECEHVLFWSIKKPQCVFSCKISPSQGLWSYIISQFTLLTTQACRLPLRARRLWQVDLLQNPFSQWSHKIWCLPQTDAGNKEIARGVTLPKEMRGGFLQHTPTLPPAPPPSTTFLPFPPSKGWIYILFKIIANDKTEFQNQVWGLVTISLWHFKIQMINWYWKNLLVATLGFQSLTI